MPRAHRGPGAASPGSFARTPWPNDAAPSSPSPYLERNRHDDGCARTARIAACFTARRAAPRHAMPPTVVASDARLAVPLMLIRVPAHSDPMHPLTSALAKSRPQFDSRPQACAHPSVLPPPVAPPLVGAAPPPPAARAG
ncbi:hypothetical protein C7S14_6532 [Burkholderia cepacia]|nr:hypothetical protein C7S14_6532 [Burkholderia cepacia]